MASRPTDLQARRLPGIRELELSYPTRRASDVPPISPAGASPSYGPFAPVQRVVAAAAFLPASSDLRTALGQPRASADSHELPDRLAGTAEVHPVHADHAGTWGSTPHLRDLPPRGHRHSEVTTVQLKPLTALKDDRFATPPGSPERPSASGSGSTIYSETSLACSDDALAESRRQRRECKERRRRRDQRNLTVSMEHSVPAWVFSRLKTRHSASKVNGGGRATNAVISGACVWLRVLDRAVRENIPHWTSSQDQAAVQTSLDTWLQLVDEEAASLEKWAEEDGSPVSPGMS